MSTNSTDDSPTTLVRRKISPYDLSSSDNPGAVISHPLLKGTNYDEWACGIKTALCSRKKFGFLDGSIKKPEDDSSDLEDWWTIQALLVSWIKMTIEPTLRSNISHRDVAQDLWEHLKRRFSVLNGPRIQQIKAELANCKQKGLAIESYFGKLNRIWDSMASYRPLRICKCGNCTCDLVTQQEKDREDDKVHQFLYGLDDAYYRTVRSSLVSRTPLPSMEEVYNIVRQEEDMKLVNKIEDDDTTSAVTAFAVQTRGRGRGDDSNKSALCKHCNRTGHLSDSCFAVIGYPEWWGERPRARTTLGRGRGGASPNGAGRGCGSVVYANAVEVAPKHTQQANYVVTDKDRDGVTGLSEVQWRNLLNILNAAPGKGHSTNAETLTGKHLTPSWILDTGASHHLTGKLDSLSDIRDMEPVLIVLADGRETVSNKEGKVRIGHSLVLNSVFYVEGMPSDLISLGQLMDENRCVVQLADHFLIIQDRISRMVIGAAKRENGAFRLRSMEWASVAVTKDEDSYTLWHKRMGHPAAKVVCSLPVVSNSVSSVFLNKACDVCLRAKQTRCSFPDSINKTLKPFDMIHTDLWGPYRTESSSGARYFLTVVDDYSRGVWIYLLKDKTEAPIQLKNFLSMVHTQFQTIVRTIRSDNGSEFISLKNFFLSKGIIHETSCVGTPQQNGRVQRKHRHILNIARALRFEASLLIEFWGECILAAGYLINRTPSSVLGGVTPYERIYNKAPSYEHLRVFGSLCYVHNQSTTGDKFAQRSNRCVFMGYPYGKKGWRLFDLEKEEFCISRDVVFVENEFPYAKKKEEEEAVSDNQRLWEPISGVDVWEEDDISNQGTQQKILQGPDVGTGPSETPTDTSTNRPIDEVTAQPVNLPSTSSSFPEHPTTATTQTLTETLDPAISEPELRRGHRRRTPSVTLKNYVTNSAQTRLLKTTTKSNQDLLYPISNYVSYGRFSATHTAYQVSTGKITPPKTYKQAVLDERFRNAMGTEVVALEANRTWDVVDLPPGKKAIGCKWVYTVKYRADGTIERFKARLVALGNKQVEGIDYKETFAPVAKMGTVRLFLDVATKRGWDVHQMDVHNAFLHGDLNEEVYMKLPPGFNSSDSTKVCRLRKSLYGLRQAPRCWFEKLSTALKDYGFQQCLSDYSLFTYTKGTTQIQILIYVDDLIITGNKPSAVEFFKKYLASCFKMKDLGLLKFFLGIEVARSKTGMYLTQRKYAMEIIKDAGLLNSKPANFPMEQNHKLALSTSPLLEHPEMYRRLVGRLIYLGVTRPDLAYSVHTLSQFMQTPRIDHWQAALRVVRYLKGSPGQGLLLRAKDSLQITGWCDSDWASCPITRRSVSGYFIQLGSSPVSWKTKKQHTVSMSSAEAEYRAMAYLTKELIWLKRILQALGIRHDQPMRVYCDSKAALHIGNNPVFHERTKHIELDCHFIRDEILAGTIATSHVSTSTQLADVFTKALGRYEFEGFQVKLGIQNLYAPT